MDFELSPELIELRDRVAAFVRDEVVPAESGTPDLDALRQKARKAGIYGPQLSREYGGLGLGTVAMCAVFEQAGRSFLGPLALNCAAPDEGNMHLLSLYATDAQREQYLRPLVEGKIRSCFAMSEPAPGAGSDPTMMQTRAARVDGGWEINGHKWFATGAAGAAFAITMAVTDAQKAVTMFLVPTDAPGFRSTTKSAFPIQRSSARSATASRWPRCASRPRDSRTACGGSVWRSARSRSLSREQKFARLSEKNLRIIRQCNG